MTVFAGMADVFGFGSQSPPKVPYFGPWQATGVQIGGVPVAIGFLLLVPGITEKKRKKNKEILFRSLIINTAAGVRK